MTTLTREETIKKITKTAAENSYASYIAGKCGNCGKYVRQAVESCIDIDNTLSAKNYGPHYEKGGFEKIFTYPEKKKDQYIPQLGDISIIQYEPHGHICIYSQWEEIDPKTKKSKTINGWISDFKQRDMYGGKIRDKDPSFTIYRLKQY